jgi:hypothetical protein
MGEYARIQMAEDARRMSGGDWEPGDFENKPAKAKKPVCPKCGKNFRVHLAVRDHMRDKHSTAVAPAVGAS